MTIGPGNVAFTYPQLMGIWEQAGGPPTTAAMAAAIAMAESGGNSAAYGVNTNGSTDRGLWQINTVNGNLSTFDIMGNARAAVSLSQQGKTWRPWCTAYSDGACGTKGGCYLCAGAPYLKFYAPGTAADNNVPINGTNAAGNQPGTTTTGATLDSANCWVPTNWLQCAGGFAGSSIGGYVFGPAGGAVGGAVGSGGANLALGIMGSIVKYIVNPLLELAAGVIGMLSGGVLMILGLWQVWRSTEVYDSYKQAKGKVQGAGLVAVGAATGQPEIIAAGASKAGGAIGAAGRQRVTTIRGQQQEGRQTRLIGARYEGQQQVAGTRAAGRTAVAQERTRQQQEITARRRMPLNLAEERTKREQIKQEALNWRASLRAKER